MALAAAEVDASPMDFLMADIARQIEDLATLEAVSRNRIELNWRRENYCETYLCYSTVIGLKFCWFDAQRSQWARAGYFSVLGLVRGSDMHADHGRPLWCLRPGQERARLLYRVRWGSSRLRVRACTSNAYALHVYIQLGGAPVCTQKFTCYCTQKGMRFRK